MASNEQLEDGLELDLLIQHIGESEAAAIALEAHSLAQASGTGVHDDSIARLKSAVQGFSAVYGAPTRARAAVEHLMIKFPKRE